MAIDWSLLFKEKELDRGMVKQYSQPHTRDIESLQTCSNRQTTGSYYFVCKYLNKPINGELMLSEIAKLQDTDETSKTYGCLRWYREEPRILDTNGAFFVLQPILIAFLTLTDKISEREKEIMMPVFVRAGTWFTGECEGFHYHYPNKIVSDGAMLLAIGQLTRNEAHKKSAHDFWERWMAYTEEYGWGWGENTSEGYSGVIVGAFDFILCTLGKEDPLYEKIYRFRAKLVDYMAYHEKLAFVPSIRTYNFTGEITSDNGFHISNYEEKLAKESGPVPCGAMTKLILHELAPKYIPCPDSSDFHRERIFGDSYAATFKGENIRLGTVSRFPVMPGCYQESNWGLGWQSMPVSVLAKKHGTSFLRFANITKGELRTHIAYNKHYAYLNTSIFADENIPDFATVCVQERNHAVVVRTLNHVANKSSYLADEWYVQRFEGELKEYSDWYAFLYGDCVLAVKPLNGKASVKEEGGNIRICQVIYEGDDKVLVLRKSITAWAVAVLDDVTEWQEQLDRIRTSYTEIKDLRFPRVEKPFEITCGEAKLTYDPYESLFHFWDK